MKEKLSKREKIIISIVIGTGVVSVCTAGYLGYRYGYTKARIETVDSINLLEAKVKTLQEAASEGLYEEAIATVTRKINYLKDRIEYCNKNLRLNPNDKQGKEILKKYEIKLDVLSNRKEDFLKAQKAYSLIVE